MLASYLAAMKARVDEGGELDHRNAVDLLAEVVRLRAERAALTPPHRIPREPTTAMIAAGQTAWLNDPARRSTTLWRAMYDEAILRAPAPEGAP